jgi:hypothetical protein
MMSDGSLSYEQATLHGWKKAMDHVTVLHCSNMSGTDKRKLLVIRGLVQTVYQFCTMLTKMHE